MAVLSGRFSSMAHAQEPVVYDRQGKTIIRQIKDLPDGGILNLTFKSQIDGSLQPFLVKVPKGYTYRKVMAFAGNTSWPWRRPYFGN